MSNEEARRIVNDGLERRKILFAQQEAALEQYEQDMIGTCNIHCAGAKKDRLQEESRKKEHKQRAMERAAKAREKAEKARLEYKAVNAARLYFILCLVTLLVSAVTKLPVAVALAMIVSGAIFPIIYIFRLYNPLEVTK